MLILMPCDIKWTAIHALRQAMWGLHHAMCLNNLKLVGSLIFDIILLSLIFFWLMFWIQNYADEENLAQRFSGELKKGGIPMFILINLEAKMALRLEICWLINWAISKVIDFLFLTIIHILLGSRGRVQSCTWSEHHAQGWVSAIFFLYLTATLITSLIMHVNCVKWLH